MNIYTYIDTCISTCDMCIYDVCVYIYMCIHIYIHMCIEWNGMARSLARVENRTSAKTPHIGEDPSQVRYDLGSGGRTE